MESSDKVQASDCYHCGLPIPKGTDYSLIIQGKERSMCCPGCLAIAQAIISGGLDNYYKHRTEIAESPKIRTESLPEALLMELKLYDDPKVQQSFVHQHQDNSEAILVIEGITCAACVWLLENHIKNIKGVEQVQLNMTNHRARIHWSHADTQLSHIITEIYRIGYKAHPYHPDKEEQLLEQEKRKALRRLGVAGIGMMQTMMMAVALYGGALQGIEDKHIIFLRWTSLIIATPVALYAARPFLTAAIRDIHLRHLTMDVPVSLAIYGAYFASLWATVTNSGEVYFDSVTMFTFFLLIGRFLEMQARHRTGRAGNALLNLLPASAIRLIEGKEQLIPAQELKSGDLVLVKPGHSIPADAILISDSTSVDESALTGEYLPISKQQGDNLTGGTINVENPIEIEVTKTGSDTELSAIVRLLERAQEDKPRTAQLANMVASWFVAVVLLTAIIVGAIWVFIDSGNAFWITLSVLVVTCPCALSLATPTALTAATGTLRQRGLLVTRGHVLESLANANRIIFDKTGTLTEGNLSLEKQIALAELTTDHCIQIASALEKNSEHPIARAFIEHNTSLQANQIKIETGQGIEGKIQGKSYRLGKPEYAASLYQQQPPELPENTGQWLLLADQQQPLAWFCLNDRLRADAAETVQQLQQLGLECEILTGDNSPAVAQIATALKIQNYTAGVSPAEKLAYIKQLQAKGEQIIMAGDGINDIPALAGAQTSIAMTEATDLAKTNADAVLMNPNLSLLVQGIILARKTSSIIRQNLLWALCYNALALPLAAFGFIAPYMAALGMSFSSLVVVGNAMRLNRQSAAKKTNSQKLKP